MTITRADLNSDAVGISGDKKGWVLSGVENGGTRVAGAIQSKREERRHFVRPPID